MKGHIHAWTFKLFLMTAIGVLAFVANYESAWAKNDTEVYLETKNLSNASRHSDSGIVEEFLDQHSNGTGVTDNLTLLLEKSGDYVEYDVDLADSIKSAVLKVYGLNAAIWVIPEGGEPIALKPSNGSLANRGVNLYTLTEANALSDSGNRFAVRVGYNSGTVVLNAIAIQTSPVELSGNYTLNPMGKSYIQQVHDVSAEVTRYFDDGKYATLHIPNGKHVTMAFDYVDSTADLSFEYEALGEQATVEMSTNLSDWKSIDGSSGKVTDYMTLNAKKQVYVRVSAKSGDTFLKTFKLSPLKAGSGGSSPNPSSSPSPSPGSDTSPSPNASPSASPSAAPSASPSPTPGSGGNGGTNQDTAFKPIGGKDKRYLYIPVKDLSNASRHNGERIVADFLDTYEGGSEQTVNPTLLLQDAGEYVEYDIDLNDSISKAILKVNMKDGVVSVKATGGKYVTLKAINDTGKNFDRGVAIYELTASNALSGTDRAFTVRIESTGTAVVLNSLLVEADVPAINGTYALKPLGESYMKHLSNVTQNVSRYFYNSVEPTVFIKKGGQATFQFAYGKTINSFSYMYDGVGEPLNVQASVDGKTWTTLGGTEGKLPSSLDYSSSSRVFVRFSAQIGDSFLRSFTLKPETASGAETLPVQPAGNESSVLPADQRHIYFKVGTAEEKKYMYGTSGSNVSSFESTHSGMDYDGFEGGYNTALLAKNARIFHGQSITYEFDLHDSLKSAQLKVYGMAGMKFAVAPEGKDTFTPITTTFQPSGSGRGYYVFSLTEANALAASGNKFRLMISGEFGILFELMIASDLPQAIQRGVLFSAQTEQSLQYLIESRNVGTYYAHERFPNYLLGGENGSNSYLLYRLDFGDEVSNAVLFATQSGFMKIGLSHTQNGEFATVLQSGIGGSGTPPTSAIDISEYLAKGRTLFIKVSGEEQQGYLDSLGIAVTPPNAASGSFDAFTADEASYLYSISGGAEGYGQASRQHEDAVKLRSVDANGEIVYRIDLADELQGGVELSIEAAEGQFDLLVSSDNANYRSILAQSQKGAHKVQEHEALLDNPSKTLYVKVRNPSTSDAFIFKGMSFTTDNVAPLRQFEHPETGEFDYNDELPTELAGFKELPDPGAGGAISAEKSQEGGMNTAIWIAIIAGAAVIAAGGVYVFIYRRNKGGSMHG